MKRLVGWGVFASASLTLVGCAQILGLGDYAEGEGGGASTSGTTSTGDTTGNTSGNVSTTTSTASTSGSVSSGMVCTPGMEMRCAYTGQPPTTEGVGVCRAGVQLCNDEGTGFDACSGEVTPAAGETCGNGMDDDCNGMSDDGCQCTAGTTEPCYDGPNGTAGNGICVRGDHTCNPDGFGYGPCTGQVLPEAAENCATGVDDDCDGTTNEAAEGCVCTPASTDDCYTGPAGTLGEGICVSGTQTCNPDGKGYGACVGQVTPAAETCRNASDEDCDSLDCIRMQRRIAGSPFIMGGKLDPSGNLIVAGYFTSSITFGGGALISSGSNDIFVAKLDPLGNHLWSKRFGDAASQSAYSMDVGPAGEIAIGGYMAGTADFGGGVLTSAGGGDYFVAVLDANGNHRWSKRYGDATNTGNVHVAFAPNGDLAIAGRLEGTVNFGGGNLVSAGAGDVFVAKLTGATGANMWQRRWGDSTGQDALGVNVDVAGNVLVVGTVSGTTNFGVNPVITAAAGTSNGFLLRLDGSGNPSCVVNMISSSIGSASSVDSNAAGDIFVAGDHLGTLDINGTVGGGVLPPSADPNESAMFYARYSPTCTNQASRAIGTSTLFGTRPELVVTPDGFVIGGHAGPSVDFGSGVINTTDDLFLVKFTMANAVNWYKIFPISAGAGPDYVTVGGGFGNDSVLTASISSSGNTVNLGLGDQATGASFITRYAD